VSHLLHAKAQSSQNGNECYWYLVLAMPHWIISALRAVHIDRYLILTRWFAGLWRSASR
jgi:hypothetical protein